tara:strand:- start:2351 stop:2902 length:552 start_codon:yes stop_codon:yes gene_type:complete
MPITIFIWSIRKQNRPIEKLLSNYWKVSILFFISQILFIGQQNFALLILNISTILITISLWFWRDINLELREYEITHYLSSITKIWRWTLTFLTFIFLAQSLSNISCLYSININSCTEWIEPSKSLYSFLKNLFNFLFGANFSEPVAKFLGLFALLIYFLGIVQWLIIKFPKTGRNSGFSGYN